MLLIESIKTNMAVLSSDDKPVGVVLAIDGNDIKLKKDDKNNYHFIPFSSVKKVDTRVFLSGDFEATKASWRTEEGPTPIAPAPVKETTTPDRTRAEARASDPDRTLVPGRTAPKYQP